jgi:hypothetical protein
MSNEKKSEQLGMSYGKAGNILRKDIIFHLAHKAGMGDCFQCGKMIDDVDNFSIEHKVPWLDSEDPIGLYFSFDNIAFSHTHCNLKAKRNATTINSAVPSSGFRGVVINGDSKKDRFKYVVRINDNGKKKFVGYANDPLEGAKMYDAAAIELHGEKAITNKLMGLY